MSGSIRDRHAKIICGKGWFISEDIKISNQVLYGVWRNMLRTKDVSEEWLCFDNFYKFSMDHRTRKRSCFISDFYYDNDMYEASPTTGEYLTRQAGLLFRDLTRIVDLPMFNSYIESEHKNRYPLLVELNTKTDRVRLRLKTLIKNTKDEKIKERLVTLFDSFTTLLK
jgi:hypothetical protein